MASTTWITDKALMRAAGNLPDALDGELTPHLYSAQLELTKWIGAAKYAEALAAVTHPLDLANEVSQQRALALAEANLAIYFALPSLNFLMGLQGDKHPGIHKRQTQREREMELLTPDEETKKREMYRRTAYELAKDYLVSATASGSSGPGISHALDKDGDVIDECWPLNKTNFAGCQVVA